MKNGSMDNSGLKPSVMCLMEVLTRDKTNKLGMSPYSPGETHFNQLFIYYLFIFYLFIHLN